MQHKLKLIFEQNRPDIDKDLFQRSLPTNFKLIEEEDGIYIYVETDIVNDEQLEYFVNRELDRHFFLTCVKIKAALVKSQVTLGLEMSWRIHGALPTNIKPQQWNYELPIQLKLWALAVDSSDIILKTILFFQIIELTTSNYPKYKDLLSAPHPLTECKFVRNLVAHAGNVSADDLKLYCKYSGLPEIMYDPTDIGYITFAKSKVKLLETQAKEVIIKSLQI